MSSDLILGYNFEISEPDMGMEIWRYKNKTLRSPSLRCIDAENSVIFTNTDKSNEIMIIQVIPAVLFMAMISATKCSNNNNNNIKADIAEFVPTSE